jgi:hypothetical protein
MSVTCRYIVTVNVLPFREKVEASPAMSEDVSELILLRLWRELLLSGDLFEEDHGRVAWIELWPTPGIARDARMPGHEGR